MIIKKLLWDEWNRMHIAKHNVEPDEVEEVCQSKNLFERGRDGTYQITGQTESGRYLNIVVVLREKGFYPVTARDADDKERRRFKKKL
ncbi:BrnT family toxin [Candidatus Daviesbacteria bacterium]|nr:BrnT family toxin [Candidatus Daviesbacteria bacterium]